MPTPLTMSEPQPYTHDLAVIDYVFEHHLNDEVVVEYTGKGIVFATLEDNAAAIAYARTLYLAGRPFRWFSCGTFIIPYDVIAPPDTPVGALEAFLRDLERVPYSGEGEHPYHQLTDAIDTLIRDGIDGGAPHYQRLSSASLRAVDWHRLAALATAAAEWLDGYRGPIPQAIIPR